MGGIASQLLPADLVTGYPDKGHRPREWGTYPGYLEILK